MRPLKEEVSWHIYRTIPSEYQSDSMDNKLSVESSVWLLMKASGLEKDPGKCHIERQTPYRLRVIYKDKRGVFRHLFGRASVREPDLFDTESVDDELFDSFKAQIDEEKLRERAKKEDASADSFYAACYGTCYSSEEEKEEHAEGYGTYYGSEEAKEAPTEGYGSFAAEESPVKESLPKKKANNFKKQALPQKSNPIKELEQKRKKVSSW